MSAEISTLVRPDTISLGTLTVLRTAATAPLIAHAPAASASAVPRSPSLDDAEATFLEPLVDVMLRFLWALVGCYVWVVLLAKGPRPRSASRELEPIVWPQADYPAVGLPAIGLSSAGSIRRPVSPDFDQMSARP
ncbi:MULTISPECIES: hypothetical protein [unclassified Cryobacterium]|uniref:hypothetical protein n=1 Tax=unclassified Cryobacterium TaxID=2649013 RepID=UPI00106A54D1|nr:MULTISPECIES: hypothetical protein [unclassified Cryobacterium]TFB98566.1 hypothetical protein E3O39_06935 [Cryobacterium sp. MDB2-A-1]TFC08449.1 hypothetical protein E3O59_08300 [Cryobacterium sp. MDB2-33-2]TFC08715.1 hypothetical protein E3O35_17605 [Cryobacterium sp. MDB2-A-2]TFC22229.1 hypothetical protein E3O51_02380 [Cryobacterium sp. MDB2-10]